MSPKPSLQVTPVYLPVIPPLPNGEPAPIDPVSEIGLNTRFLALKHTYDLMKAQMDRGEIGQTQIAIEMYTTLRENFVELLAQADAKYRINPNERTAYQVNNFTKQIMDLTQELRRMESFAAQVDRIVAIVSESVKMIGTNIISEMQPALEGMSPADQQRLRHALQGVFKHMNAIEQLARERATNLFTTI